MFIKYGKNDYLVVDSGGKLLLGSAIGKGKLLLEKGIEKEETAEIHTFKKKEVKANLGQKPMVGKSVYGLNVTPYVRSVIHPHFGQINVYFDMDPKDEKRFIKALDRSWKVLKKNKCIAAFPVSSIALHKGKRGNVGKFNQKVAKNKDITRSIAFNLEDYADKDYLNHSLFSIFAKAIWMNQVPEDVQHKWTKLYHKYLVLRTLNQKQLNSILDSINDYCQNTENGNISTYMKESCDDEDKTILNAVIRQISSVHKIKKAQLDRLIIRDPDFVKDIWPSQVDFSLPKSSISLAAEKSVEEMFSECLAFYFQGADLNKTFKKYVTNTLKSLDKKFED